MTYIRIILFFALPLFEEDFRHLFNGQKLAGVRSGRKINGRVEHLAMEMSVNMTDTQLRLSARNFINNVDEYSCSLDSNTNTAQHCTVTHLHSWLQQAISNSGTENKMVKIEINPFERSCHSCSGSLSSCMSIPLAGSRHSMLDVMHHHCIRPQHNTEYRFDVTADIRTSATATGHFTNDATTYVTASLTKNVTDVTASLTKNLTAHVSNSISPTDNISYDMCDVLTIITAYVMTDVRMYTTVDVTINVMGCCYTVLMYTVQASMRSNHQSAWAAGAANITAQGKT